jgi:hypothetical protein
MRKVSATLALATAMLFPANAAGSVVPPGNSAADQYAETLPGAGGNQAGGTGGGQTGGGPHQSVVSAATQHALDQLGPAGQATSDLANRTAPRDVGRRVDEKGRGPTSEEPSGSSGFLTALKQAASSGDSGGMGVGLPLILAGSLLAAFAFLQSRRRGIEKAAETERTGSTGP